MSSLAGETLGQRHIALNRRTNETVTKKLPFALIENLPELCDADRLYKIDVGAKYRNVPYILYNLKSDDDLYVARALKKSPWLFSQAEYADIINPEYLETQLYPAMTTRAVCKTRLSIRLHLKDENRAEQFYTYLYSRDHKKEALKWLPKCSVAFIENKVKAVWEDIDADLFKKLCERTFKAFEIITSKSKHKYGISSYLQSTMFLLNTNPEQFLDLFEEVHGYGRPTFKKHATKIILIKCPDRIRTKLETYIRNIDLTVLGKFVGPQETKEIIVKMAKIKSLRGWFHYRNLRPLIETLPKEGKFEFVKKVFVDKAIEEVEDVEDEGDMDSMFGRQAVTALCKKRCRRSVNVSSTYQWYRMAPFPLAFTELKKLIRTESSADERVAMLKILIGAAGKNKNHIFSLLQYFRERHINEPAKIKASFISSLLSATDAYKYDESSWKLLDEILHSLEFYTDGDHFSDLNSAVHAIILYNLLHEKPIPEVILQKFIDHFSTLHHTRKHLNEDEKNTVYNFLRTQLQKKLHSKSVMEKNDRCDIMCELNNILELMKHWEQDMTQDVEVMKLVSDLIEVRSPADDLSCIYNTEKKWRRGLFEYSLDLVQTEDAYVNAMKHDPAMILQRRDALDYVIKSDVVDLGKVLRKLRIYFPDTIGAEFLKMYEEKLEACRKERIGYKAVAQGVCILMERDRFTNLLQSLVPENFKIKWSSEDAALVNIRKYLCLQMYMVRPPLQVDTVLLFAKGDYLQYAVPSLMSLCNKKSLNECRDFIPTLIGGPVSLQKHGIRLAFAKLDCQQLIHTFTQVWNTTKNASIRAIIFNSTFDLLCREKNAGKILKLWDLLRTFLSCLTAEEDRSVYAKISCVTKVPEIIRGELCVTSYKLLKSLPAKLNCEDLVKGMILQMANNIDIIDEDFLTEILSNYIRDMYEKKALLKAKQNDTRYHHDIINLIGEYIICCRDEVTQATRYEKVLKKIIEHSVAMWDNVGKDIEFKKVFDNIIYKLIATTKSNFIEHEPKYVNPVCVFLKILSGIGELSVEENYNILTYIKLAIEYCNSYTTIKLMLRVQMDADEESEAGETKRSTVVSRLLGPEFGKSCIAILKDDLQKHFPIISIMFTEVVKKFLYEHYIIVDVFAAVMLESLTDDPNDIDANMLAVNLYQHCIKHCNDDFKGTLLNIGNKFVKSDKREIRMYYHFNKFED